MTPVERRREPRYRFNQEVRLTVLGEANGQPLDTVISGMILDRSGRGMRVETKCFVEPGAALRLDFRSEVVFAEVCYCQPSNGHYALGLELEQSLKNLEDLSKLGQALIAPRPASRSTA